MKQYEVTITEKLERTVLVEASSAEEAEDLVADAWQEGEYTLDYRDFTDAAFQVKGELEIAQENTFSIYQLKDGNETRDLRFAPLDTIQQTGHSVDPKNYELVYTAPLTRYDNLNSIYTRFNVNRPADFTGHSLSVSDVVVLHKNKKDDAYYCDRFGFSPIPEFLKPERAEAAALLTPEQKETGEWIRTPRGSFCITDLTQAQMKAAGYGLHHQSDDGNYLIMGNGKQAYAISAKEPPPSQKLSALLKGDKKEEKKNVPCKKER